MLLLLQLLLPLLRLLLLLMLLQQLLLALLLPLPLLPLLLLPLLLLLLLLQLLHYYYSFCVTQDAETKWDNRWWQDGEHDNVHEETPRALAETDAKHHAVVNALDSNSNTHRKEYAAFMRRGTRKAFKKLHPDL